MRDLRAGYDYLHSRKFVEAYHYFVDLGKHFKDDPQTFNGCLYGQARAQIGLQQPEGAIPLLQTVIKNVPNWASPYIALARIYERREVDCKFQGRLDEASQMFELAKNTYLTALARISGNKSLSDHYQYFLNEHASPIAPPAKTFAPGFTASRQHNRSQVEAVTSQPMVPQPHSKPVLR